MNDMLIYEYSTSDLSRILGAWFKRTRWNSRALTPEEKVKLHTPTEHLRCSVRYFMSNDKRRRGYMAFTDKAATGLYSSPDGIPASELNAVNKTAHGKIIAEATDNLIFITESSWLDKYVRRSLTNAEARQLKVPKSDLSCSVMYFEDKKGNKKGYAAFTHRAMTKFYDEPGIIPKNKLEFISSTA